MLIRTRFKIMMGIHANPDIGREKSNLSISLLRDKLKLDKIDKSRQN